MKIFLTFFSLLLTIEIALAQLFPSDVWHQGKVVLINDDTLRGQIKYDIPKNSIQLRPDSGSLMAFNAHKILYFEIYDERIKCYRHFYSLPYVLANNFSVPYLFEVLYEGKLSLLCREKITQIERDRLILANELAGPLPNDSRLTLAFDFFFLEKDGTIKFFRPERRKLLSIMDRKYTEVKKYIRRNNLRYDHIRDLVRITAYYNALEGETAKLR